MDKYLKHLITKFLENDNGKMEKYYKNEVNKKGITREASIYRWCLGPSKQDELKEVLKTDKMINGKNYITLTSIRYEIRYEDGYNGIELESIIGTLKLIENEDGLNICGYFDILTNDRAFKSNLKKVISDSMGTPRQSADNFIDKLNEVLDSITSFNKEEINKYKEVVEELLE